MKILKDYLQDKDLVAFDTETDGVSKESHIIGYSVCADVEVGYYVILSAWDVTSQSMVNLETTSEAKSVMELLATKNLIMHNAIFDCYMVKNNFGIDLMPSVHTDTMILGHLLDENRSNGLKELGTTLFGDDTRDEQKVMKESVTKNGGVLTRDKYELYKADADLIAKYGAKDAILTLKLFYIMVPDLYEQELDKFFYEEESMPLLRGPTYDLNTEGLKVDPDKLMVLKKTLEADCLEAKSFILREIQPHVAEMYPGTKPSNTFNIGASKQLAWLLYIKLGNQFNTLTKVGKDVCKALGLRLPYSPAAKRDFIYTCDQAKGTIYEEAVLNPKTGKMGRPKKFGDSWTYIACGKESLQKLESKYKWVARLLEYSKNLKLLNTYVEGIQSKMQYNIIRPSFLQHGTTSGRYSSKQPNFQNLPRDDKRIKSCIVSRPGKVFVGADYSQLEPRVFASFSGDERLLACFANGDDFYSVIGAEVFEKFNCSMKKDDENSFAKKYPQLRNISKVVALSSTYGTTAPKMAPAIGKTIEEANSIIEEYFEKFPSVKKLMLESHQLAKDNGAVHNLFGRPRRMPKAKIIKELFGNTSHEELDYEYRNILNLAINHRIQSTGASIMNRAAIACWKACRDLEALDPLWKEVKLVMQVHDELILEGPEQLSEDMVIVLRDAMENTTTLPGVALLAEPKIGKNLAELK